MDSSIALYNNSWPIVSIIKFNHVLENNSIFSYKTNPECKIILYISNVCVCVLTQSCLPLCNPMDYSPPGSSVQGILQARILEWVATPFSKGSSQLKDQTRVSCTSGRFFTVYQNHLGPSFIHIWASLVAQLVKNLPAMWETWVRSLCWE